jgi:hypothetical protein
LTIKLTPYTECRFLWRSLPPPIGGSEHCATRQIFSCQRSYCCFWPQINTDEHRCFPYPC